MDLSFFVLEKIFIFFRKVLTFAAKRDKLVITSDLYEEHIPFHYSLNNRGSIKNRFGRNVAIDQKNSPDRLRYMSLWYDGSFGQLYELGIQTRHKVFSRQKPQSSARIACHGGRWNPLQRSKKL